MGVQGESKVGFFDQMGYIVSQDVWPIQAGYEADGLVLLLSDILSRLHCQTTSIPCY